MSAFAAIEIHRRMSSVGTNAECQLRQAMSEFMGTAEDIYSC
jgi:hypothetical protein